MKIQVQSPLKRDFIRETVDAVADPKFTFVEEKGMNLVFDTDAADSAVAIAAIKKAIKATEIGAVLYFSVTEVK
ncbi:MAG: hypothetical protein LBL41_01120 [Bifidobacteriaceae bacterium]|jgi:hypothetical protein|nr:hypothetical protein [Bifidobacteriaceae bacterium]